MISVLLLIACCSSPESKADLQEEANKALALSDFEKVWNQGILDAIDEIYDADVVKHMNGRHDIIGIEAIKESVSSLHKNFSDIQFTIEDQIAQYDKVLTHWRWTATHTGELMGIPPSGVRFTITGMAIYQIAGGKIKEIWVNSDAFGLWQQLGAIQTIWDDEE
jgi:steroid delta-isomerase-like uncharacterized protein